MIATLPITIDGDHLAVHFDRFDLGAYRQFLKVKRLPEYTVEFHDVDETYTIRAPKRFAAMLGADLPRDERDDLPLSAFLFDDQQAIVRMALDAKRFACWSDCGLGKTLIQLEFGRQVIHRTGGRVLILTMNEIVGQTVEECRQFYGDGLPIVRLGSRSQLKEWCQHGTIDGQPAPALAITNYEKMNPSGPDDDQVVNEMRHLAGLILDESSRLKTGGGVQKWAVIHSGKGIEYKLSCTATPAPNDWMEYASQASFLERMRTESEILWTYFSRDEKSHRWTIKPHAVKPFFEFLSGWSIYIKDPRKYGWRTGWQPPPEPETFLHEIAPTPEQLAAMQRYVTAENGQMRMFRKADVNAIERAKLSQIAKGFVYLKGESSGAYERIASRKPLIVADLIQQELAAGLQTLVWTVFNAESDLIAQELDRRGVAYHVLDGGSSEADRAAITDAFRRGENRLLLAKASMLGFGQNFQRCGSMIFSGFNDSYEAFYQAIRRAYRHGQMLRLRVHLPLVRELEGDMLENLFDKEGRHLSAVSEMEANYMAARQRTLVA